MSILLERVARTSPYLSGQDFKMLVVMASLAENSPPTYERGWDQIAVGMGWRAGSNAAHTNVARRIKSLVDQGFLVRVHQGGLYEYAQYQFAFPYEEES